MRNSTFCVVGLVVSGLVVSGLVMGGLVAAGPLTLPALSDEEVRLVLKGLDPVQLIQGEERPGREDLTAEHQGFLYRFVDAENKKTFQDDPGRYGVQLRGACPVRPDLAGKGDIFLVYEKRIYLFFSEHCRGKFQAHPEGYRGNLPDC